MSRSRLTSGALCVLLAVVTVLVYLPVRHFAFVHYDDAQYVTQNPAVQAGLTWRGVEWAFTTLDVFNWQPLTWLSHMLDCQLFGLNAGAHHLVNVGFHAANAVLLFVLLLRLTGAVWQSALIAALFAWHPLRVESVAWVAERKDVLSAFFGFLALLAYAGYAQRRSSIESRESEATSGGVSVPANRLVSSLAPPNRTAVSDAENGRSALDSRLSILDYSLALFFFACGLMAKPMLVTLPFVFLLLDFWPLNRVTRDKRRMTRLLWEKWPFFVLVLACCVVTFVAQKAGGAIVSFGVDPLWVRLGNAAVSYVAYLCKTVYPADLAVVYPLPKEIGWWQFAGAILVLAAVTGLVWRVRVSRPYLLTGWLWYLGMLVPVIGFVQVGLQAMADRYTYLPQIGIFIAIVFGLGELAGKLRLRPAVLISSAGIVLTACLWLTARQLQYWRNGETLFRHALAVTTNNPIGQNNLGIALEDAGQPEQAAEHFREASQLEPYYAAAQNNLAAVLLQTGHPQEAIEHYQEALRLKPSVADVAKIHNNLGNAFVQTRQLQEAIQQYQEALQFNPNYGKAYYNLGRALALMGHPNEAIEQFQKALQLEPDFVPAHVTLGTTLLQTGHPQQAADQFRQALQLDPDTAMLHFDLGNALLRQGQVAQAIAHYQVTIKLEPDSALPLNNLAWLLATCPEAGLRNGQEAVQLAERACRLTDYKLPHLIGTLAAAYAEAGRYEDAVKTAEQAIALATAGNQEALAKKTRERLKLYQAHKAYHQPAAHR